MADVQGSTTVREKVKVEVLPPIASYPVIVSEYDPALVTSLVEIEIVGRVAVINVESGLFRVYVNGPHIPNDSENAPIVSKSAAFPTV